MNEQQALDAARAAFMAAAMDDLVGEMTDEQHKQVAESWSQVEKNVSVIFSGNGNGNNGNNGNRIRRTP